MKHLAQKLVLKNSRKAIGLLFGFLAIFLSFSVTISAQLIEAEYLEKELITREFDRKNWQKVTEDLDYSGLPVAEKEKVKKSDGTYERGRRRRRSRSSGGSGFSLGPGFFKGFAIVAGIALLSWIIMSLLGGIGPVNSRISPKQISLENIEDHILETELEGYIREAVEGANYALAVRLYYLAIIKELSLKKLIKWKRDKTNGEYVRETRRTDFYQKFQELTLIFERVWYGGKTIEETDYQAIAPKFKTLVERIQRS